MNFPKPEIDREEAMQLWISEQSDYAKEQVIINNYKLVGIVLKSLNLNLFDEDLWEIGLWGIVKAIETFNPDNGTTFSGYATPIIRNEILMTLRKKRIVSCVSLDEPCDLENGEQVSYADMIENGSRFEEEVIAGIQLKNAIGLFSERERKIISLKMIGKTQGEIAEICGISQAQVSRDLKRAFNKCKKELEG